MANESVAIDPHKLWSMNGRYQIAPGTTSMQLAEDAGCLLEGVLATVGVLTDGLQEVGGNLEANPHLVASSLYGVQFNLEMIKGMLGAIATPKEA